MDLATRISKILQEGQVTIRYENSRGEIKEKTFPSEESMQRWTEKNEVKVVAYSKDPTDSR